MKMFRFVNCNSVGFSNMYAFNILYTLIVCFVLKYGSIFCSFHQKSCINRLKKRQNNFFKLAHFVVALIFLNL